jgi:hypothetical protein
LDRANLTERKRLYELEQFLWLSHKLLVEGLKRAEALDQGEAAEHLLASHMRLGCAIETIAVAYQAPRDLVS